jgi:hypothetical protein
MNQVELAFQIAEKQERNLPKAAVEHSETYSKGLDYLIFG